MCSSPDFGVLGNRLVKTSLFVRAAKVAFPINFSADADIITCTSAFCFFNRRIISHALKAAIEPVTHNNIFLFFNGFIF